MREQLLPPTLLAQMAISKTRKNQQLEAKKVKEYHELILWHVKDMLPQMKDMFAYRSKLSTKHGARSLMISYWTGEIVWNGYSATDRQRIRKDDGYIDERCMYDDIPFENKLLLSDGTKRNIRRVLLTKLGQYLKRKKFRVYNAKLPKVGRVLLIEW